MEDDSIMLSAEDIAYRKLVFDFLIANKDSKTLQEDLSPLLASAPLTDRGNGLRLFARFGRDLRHVSDRGTWLEWNGAKWAADDDNIIISLAGDTAAWIEEEAKAVKPEKISAAAFDQLTEEQKETRATAMERYQTLKKWSHSSQSKSHMMAMVDMLKSEPGALFRSLYGFETWTRYKIGLKEEQIDSNDMLLNFKNCSLVLGLDDLHTKPHDRYDFCMKQINYDYNIQASAPQWKAFIAKVTSAATEAGTWIERNDLALYIQAIAGTGTCGRILDEILPVFRGFGGNGKSIFSEILKDTLGDYSVTANADLFMKKKMGGEGINNDVARLSGVRLCIAEESAEGKQLNEALVKNMTGGTKLTARFLRQEFFEFMPKFTGVLMTNHAPVISGTDNGIWRRLKLVPWDYSFEKDPERKDRSQVMDELRTELPGIMNWLIEGLQMRLAMRSMDYLQPDCVTSATKQYKEDSDILGQYIEENLIQDPKASISLNDLYSKFAPWAKESGYIAPGKKTVSQRLVERGWTKKKVRTGWIWTGWRAIEPTDDLPELKPEPERF